MVGSFLLTDMFKHCKQLLSTSRVAVYYYYRSLYRRQCFLVVYTYMHMECREYDSTRYFGSMYLYYTNSPCLYKVLWEDAMLPELLGGSKGTTTQWMDTGTYQIKHLSQNVDGFLGWCHISSSPRFPEFLKKNVHPRSLTEKMIGLEEGSFSFKGALL